MSAVPSAIPDIELRMQLNYAVWPRGEKHTFRCVPIKALLRKYITPDDVVVDPFAGESQFGTYRNNMAESGLTANQFLDSLIGTVTADAVILDPPYSPTQIKRAYAGMGLSCSRTDTQNARLYSDARERLNKLLRPGGVAISCGWNSTGFGQKYGYKPLELLVVNHGAAHHDTLIKVEMKP